MSEEKNIRILVVDDEDHVCRLLARWLSTQGYDCRTATSGEAAWEMAMKDPPELAILDIMMPGMSGIELLARFAWEQPDVAVIMVTAVDDRRTAEKALELGAYGYVIKPFEMNEIFIHVAGALHRRKLVAMKKRYTQDLEREVRERTESLRKSQEEIIVRLLMATEFRDEETGAHIRRIGRYAATLAEAAGWRQSDVDDILLAASMHDIGKIGISDTILLKPGKLTREECERVKHHPRIGAGILAGSDIPLIRMAHDIALTHHEKWDGTGYPNGLAGEEIPESGRITAICDVYDALIMDRPYRAALPEEEVLRIMTPEKGRSFDPRLFDIFMDVLPSFRRIGIELS